MEEMKLCRFQRGSFLESINVRCGLVLGSKKNKRFHKIYFYFSCPFWVSFYFVKDLQTVIKYFITGHSKREIKKRRNKKEEKKEREDSLSRIKNKTLPGFIPREQFCVSYVMVL